ncbi:methyl-accepting chemotaxis protein [Aliterella atlantica]|uniref:methyl-accepting chemotaxis protein n=1 Tax=Aliterella atlantica TaxID=1827278 RepID=UPI000698A62E|nr:methyl-accepting chemotaxis protein [Aliterella atlantica]
MTTTNNNSYGTTSQDIESLIASLQAEVELDSTDLVSKISLATALEQSGRISAAKAVYQEVVDADPAGSMGAIALKALEALDLPESSILPAPSIEPQASPQAQPIQPQKKQFAPTKSLRQTWDNLSLRTKLAIFLVASGALPVIAVTQGLVTLNHNRALQDLKASLQKDGSSFRDEYVLWTQVESETKAENLAALVEATKLDLSNPSQVASSSTFIQNSLKIQNGENPESNKSFQIFTDNQGRVVGQEVQIIDGDFTNNLLPTKNASTQKYRVVQSLPIGTNLKNIPIVQAVLKTGQPLSGMELLKQASLQSLGLEKQADIGLRAQPTNNLPEAKTPFPAGTYDIEEGKIGLVSMAVRPVKIGNKVVGTVIVGALQNRNYDLVDKFSQNYAIDTATVFARDWRVATNVPYSDRTTRAVGTRVAREVADKVLNQGEDFNGKTNIIGQEYLTFYSPIYDHQKQLNPQAKPVGMAYVGESLDAIEGNLRSQQLLAYGIGLGSLVLLALVATWLASYFVRPLRQLSSFAQQVAQGEQGVRLENTDRQDEIGVLAKELNQMAVSIEANLNKVREQQEQSRQEAEKQRKEKENLQQGVIGLLLEIEGAQRGDLTVQAKVNEDAMGSIADAFNATIRSLREIVTQVKVASSQVQASTFSSEATVGKLSEEATTQAQAVNQALSSVEEIGLSIQLVADSAQKAAAIAREAVLAAKDGGETMDKTVGSIQNIRASVAETSKKVKRLAESSQEISKIVSIISGISEKTNLLAFNASIEAARAGENGQGFRVVADEVRRLAERVTDSTKEIEQLVSTIQVETAEVLQTMEASTTQVVTGTQLVGKTKQTLQGLATISNKIDELLQSISASTVSQTQASQMVNKTMQEVAAIAQNTSNESEVVSVSLKQLVGVAEELQNSVSRFQVAK